MWCAWTVPNKDISQATTLATSRVFSFGIKMSIFPSGQVLMNLHLKKLE